MFHYRVENGPEFAGNERLGAFEYSGGQNIASPFNFTGDAGYCLAGNLDRPPVSPATEAPFRRPPRFAEYGADEARKLVASQCGDETLIVDELDDLIAGLEPEIGFESMFSDSNRFRFPDQFACLRGLTLLGEARISRLMSIAGADWVIAPIEITSTPVFA